MMCSVCFLFGKSLHGTTQAHMRHAADAEECGAADLSDSMPGVLLWTEKKQNALAGLVTCARVRAIPQPMSSASCCHACACESSTAASTASGATGAQATSMNAHGCASVACALLRSDTPVRYDSYD